MRHHDVTIEKACNVIQCFVIYIYIQMCVGLCKLLEIKLINDVFNDT